MDLEEPTLHLSSKKSKFLIFILTLLIVSLVLLGTTESFSHSRASDKIEFYNVNKGASFNSILDDFALNPFEKVLLKIYLKKTILKLHKLDIIILKINLGKKFFSVSSGDVIIYKLKIPSGKNLYEIEKIISESNLQNDCNNFDCLDDQLNYIEGTLKPDTYFYKHSSSLAKILKNLKAIFYN